MCTPIEACVAPGPRVTKRDAGATSEFADSFRHVGGSGFVPADDGLNAFGLVMQRVEYGKKTLARYGENAFDAVRQQGIDQKTRTSGGGGCRNGG